MIPYECFCGYTREVPDNWLGKSVKCPQCGNTGEVFKPSDQNGNDKWAESDNYIPKKFEGNWRPSPWDRVERPSRPLTWTQGAWIIALLAIPFVLAIVAFLIYVVAAILK